MIKEDTNLEANFNIEEENTIKEGTNIKVECVPLQQTTLKTTSLKRRQHEKITVLKKTPTL
jgi:hypothetical protein